VVFVSSDRDSDAFKSYYGEMPWLALPYEDRDAKAALSQAALQEHCSSPVLRCQRDAAAQPS
jgi:hypothetical protein